MIKIVKCIIIIGIVAVNGSAAVAQKEKVIFKKKETYRFSGLKLKGQYKKPELSYIYQRKGIRSEQIIDIPENFNDKIREGVKKF
jgi:hypothetical protein